MYPDLHMQPYLYLQRKPGSIPRWLALIQRRENFKDFLRPGYGGPFNIRDDCGARRTLESLSDWVRGYDFETKAEWYAVRVGRRWKQVLFLCIGGWCGDMTRIPLGEEATGATKW